MPRPSTLAFNILLALVLAAAGASLFFSFFHPIAPDLSLYLLHTRTFLETFARFENAFDSKGFVVVLWLAPFVKALGPTMAAGALAQAAAYTGAAALTVRYVRPWLTRGPAVLLAASWIVLAFSPRFWGGRVRPEDLLLLFHAAALLGYASASGKGLFTSGAATTLALLTKASFGLSFAVLAFGFTLTFPADQRRWARRAAAWAAGAASALLPVLLWLVLFDSPSAWFEQSFAWPFRFRRAMPHGLPANPLVMLHHAGLLLLVLAGFAGALRGLFSAHRKHAVLVLALMTGELLRVALEGTGWPYLVSPLVLPAIVGASLLLVSARDSWWRWVLPFLLVMEPAAITLHRQGHAFHLRARQGIPTPEEALVEAMRESYQPGERVLPLFYGHTPQLLLGAPAHGPVPYINMGRLPRDQREALQAKLLDDPPAWVCTALPQSSPRAFHIVGQKDGLFYGFIPHDAAEGAFADKPPPPGGVWDLLLQHHPYRLRVDIGPLQAWHLSREAARPATPRSVP